MFKTILIKLRKKKNKNIIKKMTSPIIKFIIIRNCFDCPYAHSNICMKDNKTIDIDNKFSIPKECPLPDYDQGDRYYV